MRDADLEVDTDRMPELFRSAAVREIERRAVAHEGSDEDELMTRAGHAAWRCLLQHWPQAQRIGIACGPGNNGGDGYVLAELARRSGRHVHVVRLGDTVKPGPAQRAADLFRQAGGLVEGFRAENGLPDADVWVDALFGIGLHRALEGAAADLVRALNRAGSHGAVSNRGPRTPVFALDVPSGVDADSGHHHGLAVNAGVTLSFICAKPGLYTGRGRAAAGEVRVDTLGIDPSMFDGIEPSARLARPDRLAQWLRPRARDAHKGRFGHVLCIGGDHGYGGALALCVEAAHRSGAGLVSAVTRAEHIAMLLTRRPECMAHAWALHSEDAAQSLAVLLDRASALAIGPGLGQGAWGHALLQAALARQRPMAIDADALNALARQDAVRLPHAVLTPHPGEAARLLGTPVDEVESDRIEAARRLAARYDATVILKGAGTVVMTPGDAERASVPVIVDAGNPGMASGGMGDALTGTVAALLAQFCMAKTSLAPRLGSDLSGGSASALQGRPDGVFAAAVCGALLHSAAADRAARDGGERGLLASDLLPHLRRLANPERWQ